MLLVQQQGNYRYLPSVNPVPFCSAVIADRGFEIVHATLARPLPWRAGFQLAERHLAALGRPRQAVCAAELRCAEPYTPEGFRTFNAGYAELLQEWGLFVDGLGTTARTNVAPDTHAPTEQVMLAFSYTVPATGAGSSDGGPTFVVSGSPERPDVRPGDTSPEALREKVADVLATLTQRLEAIGFGWDATTEVNVYATVNLWEALRAEALPRLGPAALHGLRWYPSRPPVTGPAVEIDTRGVRHELRLAV